MTCFDMACILFISILCDVKLDIQTLYGFDECILNY